MVDWLIWPAQFLINTCGMVASWFVSKDSLGFLALQLGFGLLVLAAVVFLVALLQSLVGYWRSRPRTNRGHQ